jgi:hypothetical protein
VKLTRLHRGAKRLLRLQLTVDEKDAPRSLAAGRSVGQQIVAIGVRAARIEHLHVRAQISLDSPDANARAALDEPSAYFAGCAEKGQAHRVFAVETSWFISEWIARLVP